MEMGGFRQLFMLFHVGFLKFPISQLLRSVLFDRFIGVNDL